MKLNKILILLVIIALAFSVTAIMAGNKDKVGGAGAQQLLIPVGSRGIALGGAF